MWNKLKQLLILNQDDLPIALGMTALPFLLLHLVTAVVMVLVRPDESIFLGGILLPISVGLAAFTVTSGNVQISFPQAIRFSCNRKTALLLTLAQTALESLCALVAGAALLLFERHLAMPLWRFLSGNLGLLVDDFGIVWWGVPAGALVGYLLGLFYGALTLRFGPKAYWAILAMWIGFLVLFQNLPWKTHEVTNILLPVLAILMLLVCVWSGWVLLRLSIPK